MDFNDVVAISYAHGDKIYNEKVIGFVNRLRKHGYNALMDEYLKQQETAIDFNEMMANLITKSKKVIIILSPSYKDRADEFEGGVGSEYRIILDEINKNPKKFIFVSFEPINCDSLNRIRPKALGNREIIEIANNDKEWDKLFSKLTDKQIYIFEDVAKQKTEPKSKRISLRQSKDKADLFQMAKIKLFENKQALEQFGPDSRIAIKNPISSMKNTWEKIKFEKIIPNNSEIVEEFESNISVLSLEEVQIFKKFKLHAESFENCARGIIVREGVPRFPTEFEKMVNKED